MNLLITGADRPLGRLAANHFRGTHHLRLTGARPGPPVDLAALDYGVVDLCSPDNVAEAVSGVQAVLHLAGFDPAPLSGPGAEQERIELAATGTYALMSEARKAGVERVILVSTLELFGSYPEHYIIDEEWQPQPRADAESLAPYLSEIVCREFVREGGIRTICLRFGRLGQADGTSEEEALRALDAALVLPFDEMGYRWRLFHITSSDRFRMRGARALFGPGGGGGG